MKTARRLARRSSRAEVGLFLAEGPQTVREALDVAGCVREVFALPGTHADLAGAATAQGADWHLVEEHALASLTGTVHPQGVVAVCRFLDDALTDLLAGAQRLVAACADVRDPGRILTNPQLHETLDLSKPVGLVLLAIMHFIDDTEDPHAIVAQLVAGLAPGSYLVMSHATYDPMPPEIVTRLKAAIAGTGEKGGPRDRELFERFFVGLELVEPGVVPIGDWRPTPGSRVPDPADVGVYGAVARIP